MISWVLLSWNTIVLWCISYKICKGLCTLSWETWLWKLIGSLNLLASLSNVWGYMQHIVILYVDYGSLTEKCLGVFRDFVLLVLLVVFLLRKKTNQNNQAPNTLISSPPQVFPWKYCIFWFCFGYTVQICDVVMICPVLVDVPKKPLLKNSYSVKCLSLQRVAHLNW